MITKEKQIQGEKTPKSTSFEDELLKLDDDEVAYEGKGKRKYTKSTPRGGGANKGSKSITPGKTDKKVNKGHEVSPTIAPGPSQLKHTDSNNNEILEVLLQMRQEQNETNKKIETMNKRIDNIYNYEDDDHYDCDNDYDNEYEEEGTDEVPKNDVNEKSNAPQEKDEPPAKKQKQDDSRFTTMNKRFRSGEKCSSNINEDLAGNITDIFRNGISEERYRDLVKDEKVNRPENCEGLVTVQTDQLIWEVLWPITKTNDNKIKHCQTTVVKSATILSKVVDKMDQIIEKTQNPELNDIIEDCMDSLALLGHANREMCLARRELMKPDVKDEYNHLFNKSQPFNKWLFGGDVSKTVKDIGECSKISNRIHSNRGAFGGFRRFGRGYYYRGRGRGRGLRGRGRGGASRSDRNASESKNSRWAYNKYRN